MAGAGAACTGYPTGIRADDGWPNWVMLLGSEPFACQVHLFNTRIAPDSGGARGCLPYTRGVLLLDPSGNGGRGSISLVTR